MQIQNFGRNVTLSPQHYYAPENEEEVLAILNRHPQCRFRVIGRLHSWSQILESEDVLLDLKHLNQVKTEESKGQCIAHVGAGCQIKTILGELSRQSGWTLPSLGFVTEQTIAGATATGTHGSGKNSLSQYILSARVACFDPETGTAIVKEICDGDELKAIRCSLGCLGIVLSVTVECRPEYSIEEVFREYSALDDVLACEEEYPLQQFYLVPWKWSYIAQHRRETTAANSFFKVVYHWYRFLIFDLAMHLLILILVRMLHSSKPIQFSFRKLIPLCVIKNWKVTGPANEQLIMEHELFRHVEIELFVQRGQLASALKFLKDSLCEADTAKSASAVLSSDSIPSGSRYTHHYPICIRRILSDETLISMTAPRSDGEGASPEEDWYSISLINYQSAKNRQAFHQLAKYLAESMQDQFAARVHWGKLNPLSADRLRQQYPAFATFAAIRKKIDPNKQFCNDWTAILFSEVTKPSAVQSQEG